MTIDLISLVQALAALALVELTILTPLLALLLRRFLHIQLAAMQAAAVQHAADAGAKVAYGFIASNAASYRDVTIRDAAIARGVQHVVASTPEALTALGITTERIRKMVEARFGGLLAADPAVSVSAPPTA